MPFLFSSGTFTTRQIWTWGEMFGDFLQHGNCLNFPFFHCWKREAKRAKGPRPRKSVGRGHCSDSAPLALLLLLLINVGLNSTPAGDLGPWRVVDDFNQSASRTALKSDRLASCVVHSTIFDEGVPRCCCSPRQCGHMMSGEHHYLQTMYICGCCCNPVWLETVPQRLC